MKASSHEKSSLAKQNHKLTRAVRKRMHLSYATRALGFHVVSVEQGLAIFQMKVKRRHRQIHGVVHGGILATLADTVAAIAAYSTLPRGSEIATIEMKINFLEAVHGGEIRAEARVLRTGRNFVVTECEIRNEDGSLAAKSLLTFGAVSERVAANLKKRG